MIMRNLTSGMTLAHEVISKRTRFTRGSEQLIAQRAL